MKIDPTCKACGGRGESSRGRPCSPCQVNGLEIPPAPPELDAALEGFE